MMQCPMSVLTCAANPFNIDKTVTGRRTCRRLAAANMKQIHNGTPALLFPLHAHPKSYLKGFQSYSLGPKGA